MTGQAATRRAATALSIGIIAWNEEEAIGPALRSVFAQTLFERLAQRRRECEILCVTNGCTDRTPAIAADLFEEQSKQHPHSAAFVARVCDLRQRGKNNAWNIFVHQLSRRDAEYLVLMDADILLKHPDTLWNMYEALTRNDAAVIATDEPLKDISFHPRKRLRDRISLATSRLTQSSAAQVTGQLYCIRAPAARNIYLPRDLVACEDGLIKSLVCTYSLTRELAPERVMLAPDASHIFQSYTSLGDIVRNQKRQTIGQTIVHILIDKHLPTLALEEKLNLADTLQENDRNDPTWLKRLIGDHLREQRRFWRLYPNLLSSRFTRLRGLRGLRKLFYLPIAIAGFGLTLLASWLAWRFLRKGYTDYWPDTRSRGLEDFAPRGHRESPDAVLGTLTHNN